MTKEDLYLGLDFLKLYKSGKTYHEIAAEKGLKDSYVYNKIQTAKRYEIILDTNFWKAFESIGAKPNHIMSIYLSLECFIETNGFPDNRFAREIHQNRFLHTSDKHRRQSDLILKFIQSLSEWDLRKIQKSVYQIGSLRYEYIKQVHDLKPVKKETELSDNSKMGLICKKIVDAYLGNNEH